MAIPACVKKLLAVLPGYTWLNRKRCERAWRKANAHNFTVLVKNPSLRGMNVVNDAAISPAKQMASPHRGQLH